MSLSPVNLNSGKFIDGLRLVRQSSEEISVGAGYCRDSENSNNIIIDSLTVVSTLQHGINGLDNGTVVNGTYAVYVIGDSSGYNPAGTIFSLNLVRPVLPFGYDIYRRVGYIILDGNEHVVDFTQAGEGVNRWMYYGAPQSTGIEGAAAGAPFADISGLTDSIPDISGEGMANIRFEIDGGEAGQELQITRTGGDLGFGIYVVVATLGGVVPISGNLLCPWSPGLGMEWKISAGAGEVYLYVQGYEDILV